MHYVVTGGAGFIGSHLVRRLVVDGHEVTVLDNLVRGRLTNLDDILRMVRFEELDICESGVLDDVFRDADGIFHQAALGSVPESWKDPDLYRMVNVEGTRNVFQTAGKYRIRVVYASSSSVYGNVQTMPIPEDSVRDPLSPYGRTKLDCEIMAAKLAESGSQIIGLRYFNVFGTGQNPDYAGVITRFLQWLEKGEPPVIFGDGLQTRDFTFVDDVVEANLAAMSGHIRHEFFNVGGGRSTSLRNLARIMIRLSGKPLEPQYDDPRLGDAKWSTADISKAVSLLGWRPTTSLEEGLRILFHGSVSKSS